VPTLPSSASGVVPSFASGLDNTTAGLLTVVSCGLAATLLLDGEGTEYALMKSLLEVEN
jgi:hypothetical protein